MRKCSSHLHVSHSINDLFHWCVSVHSAFHLVYCAGVMCIEYMGWAMADILYSVCANSTCNYSFLRCAEAFRKRHLHNQAVLFLCQICIYFSTLSVTFLPVGSEEN